MQGIETALAALASPSRLTLAGLAFTAAIALFLLWRKHKTSWLLTGHLALGLTGAILGAISLNCALGTLTGFLVFCTMIITKLLIYVAPPAFALALITGTWLLPALHRRQYRARPLRLALLTGLCRKLGIRQPHCYALDTAKPIAFAAGNAIHLSTGMTELLSPKELEAVLLHELHHVQRRHSSLKFSAFLTRVCSPVAAFTSIPAVLAGEERAADDFAASIQGTRRHLAASKRKLSEYETLANA